MSRIWVSSHPHYGHNNVIDYCNRPFANTDDMRQGLVELIAEKVSGYWDSPTTGRWYFIAKFEDDFWEAVEAAYEG